MGVFSKVAIGVTATGAITIGGLMLWNGGDTIETAKNFITDSSEQLKQFAKNEKAMIEKINELNGKVGTLEENIIDLEGKLVNEKSKNEQNQELIATLESDISDKQNEISSLLEEKAALESELEEARADQGNVDENNETLAQRIVDLEAQLTQANEDAESLQATMDEVESYDDPLTDAELEELIGGEVSEDEEEETPELPQEETRPPNSVRVDMILDVPFRINDLLTLDVRQDGTVYIRSTNNGSYFAAYKGKYIEIPGYGAETELGHIDDLDRTAVELDGTARKLWLVKP